MSRRGRLSPDRAPEPSKASAGPLVVVASAEPSAQEAQETAIVGNAVDRHAVAPAPRQNR